MHVNIVCDSNTKLCLDIKTKGKNAGKKIVLEERKGSDSQEFILTGNRLVAKSSGKAMEFNADPQHPKILLVEQNMTSKQTWNFFDDMTIRNTDGKCLDTKGGKIKTGSKLILTNQSNQPSQKWRVTRANDPQCKAIAPAELLLSQCCLLL